MATTSEQQAQTGKSRRSVALCLLLRLTHHPKGSLYLRGRHGAATVANMSQEGPDLRPIICCFSSELASFMLLSWLSVQISSDPLSP